MTILERIKAILARDFNLDIDKITLESKFGVDLFGEGYDEIDFIFLVMAVEEDFDFEFDLSDDEEFETLFNLVTISEVVDLLRRKGVKEQEETAV